MTLNKASQYQLNQLALEGKIKLEKQEKFDGGFYCGTYYTFRNLDNSFIHTFYSTSGFGLQVDTVELRGYVYTNCPVS
jgi:hypothetical protein